MAHHYVAVKKDINIKLKIIKAMNTAAHSAIEILKQYAKESGTTVRSTSDLSPMEEWLITQFKPVEDETEIESLLGKLDSANEEISYWKNKSKAVPVPNTNKEYEWISVNNPPNEGDRVLCIEPYGNIGIANYIKFNNSDKKLSFCDEQDEQSGTYRATHWMPLPKPPKN